MIFVDFNEWPNWRFGNKILLLNNLIQISYYFKHSYEFNNFIGLELFANLTPQNIDLNYDEIITTDFLLTNKKEDICLDLKKRYKLDMSLFELFFTYNDISTFDVLKLKTPNKTFNKTLVGIHFRGTDFISWDKRAILPTQYYIDALNNLKNEIGNDFIVYLATDDNSLLSFHATIEWLNNNNILWTKGTINNWKNDFYTLSQCNYIISTPSTFCITSSLCGKRDKKIIHSKSWFEDYKLHSDYFRDIFWKELYNNQNNRDYPLHKLI